MARGHRVDDEALSFRLAPQRAHVVALGTLGRLRIGQERRRRVHGRLAFPEAEWLERRGPEVALQELGGVRSARRLGRERRQRGNVRAGGTQGPEKRLGPRAVRGEDDELARRVPHEPFGQRLGIARRKDGEVTRREVQSGDGRSAAVPGDRRHLVRATRVEALGVDDRPGRHDADDLPRDERPPPCRRLRLLGDRDLLPRADEPREIRLEGVLRDPAHRRLDVAVLVARGEHEAEKGRRDLRVLEEHLVEVPEAVEKDRVPRFPLQCPVLLEHGRRAHEEAGC